MKPGRLTINLSPELRKAVEEKLQERKRGAKTISAITRQLLARWVGRSELAEVAPPGRPRNEDNGDED